MSEIAVTEKERKLLSVEGYFFEKIDEVLVSYKSYIENPNPELMHINSIFKRQLTILA